MGKHGERRGMDDLEWYEILMCCCKCRAECKSCVVIMFMYYIPIILLLAVIGACITAGIIFILQDSCPDNIRIPCWLITSSGTTLPLFFFCVKGIADDYYGVTFWRIMSLTQHVFFTTWLLVGTAWVSIDTYDDNCSLSVRFCSFRFVLAHWFIFLLSTIGQIVIMMKICCCGAENAIKPLKGKLGTECDDLELGN